MIKRIMMFLVAVVATFSMAVPSYAKTGPFGAKLILKSECRIDFNASTNWVGDHRNPGMMAEKLVMQVSWLVNQLPEKCYADRCVFKNMDYSYYQRLKPAFLEGIAPEYRTTIAKMFKQCLGVGVNMPRPLSSGGGGGCGGGGGNSASVSVSAGSQNVSVSASQIGCSDLKIAIDGNNIWVQIVQVGRNSANLNFKGDNINFDLYQGGNQSYTRTFNGGENESVTQP